jgi:hypothetical protein
LPKKAKFGGTFDSFACQIDVCQTLFSTIIHYIPLPFGGKPLFLRKITGNGSSEEKIPTHRALV